MDRVKTKQKKVHAITQKHKVFRQSNPMLSVLMWGVNHTMNEIALVPQQSLIMDTDFKASSKVAVNNVHYNDQVLPNKFKFKEYCPIVFRDLRTRLRCDPDDLVTSVCESPLESSDSAGKSHSVFFTTSNHRYIIKTLSREEVMSFHKTFSNYHSYIVERNGETLLPHYLGMYRVTVQEKETYMIVMRTVYNLSVPQLRLYDLKGSTVDRTASEKELAKDTPTLKDNDFTTQKERLHLGAEGPEFLDMLSSDARFLGSINMMDYSLLVSIHELPEGTPVPPVDPSADVYRVGEAKEGSRTIYYAGIIDVLTKYGAKKMAAHTAKGVKHGHKAEISTVNPEQYSRRFAEFITSVVD